MSVAREQMICKNCRYWDKTTQVCDKIEFVDFLDISDVEAVMCGTADDDSGLVVRMYTGPQFGCTQFALRTGGRAEQHSAPEASSENDLSNYITPPPGVELHSHLIDVLSACFRTARDRGLDIEGMCDHAWMRLVRFLPPLGKKAKRKGN